MKLHEEWWATRILRQKEIDASIAAKAEFEYLYDKPYTDNSRVRVSGPFTVESLSPHRVMAVDEDEYGALRELCTCRLTAEYEYVLGELFEASQLWAALA